MPLNLFYDKVLQVSGWTIDRNGRMKEVEAVNALRQVKIVLDKYSFEYWLDCGTLLGAVRDAAIIPWDLDIDLFTWPMNLSDNVKRSIAKELSDKGFQVNIFKDCVNIQDMKQKVLIDIHSYRLSEDKAIWPRFVPTNLIGKFLWYFSHKLSAPYGYYEVDISAKPFLISIVKRILVRISRELPSSLRMRLAKIVTLAFENICTKDVSLVIPAEYFKDLSTMNFYGMEFRVPAKAEEYLAFRFGKNWRIPKGDWETSRDDGAVVENGWRKRKIS